MTTALLTALRELRDAVALYDATFGDFQQGQASLPKLIEASGRKANAMHAAGEAIAQEESK